MTVSRVVNNTGRISSATRQHIRDVIARLGYRPSRAARALVTNQTKMIGVIVQDITNPYFSEIVRGIEDVVSESGYSVLLVNTHETLEREETALSQFDDSLIDGLIVCSSRLPEDTLLPLLERHRAVVSVTRRLPKELASCVRPRHKYGYRAHNAARYLIEHGHQRIGYLHLARSYVAMYTKDFIERLAADGIVLNPEWMQSVSPLWDSGYAAGKDLLTRHPELTAIIGGNDLVALGVMRAAREFGRCIPDDLALIGGDDILLADQVTPPLTTFRAPKYDIGTMAAELLLKRMHGDTTYREYTYEEVLIERGTAP